VRPPLLPIFADLLKYAGPAVQHFQVVCGLLGAAAVDVQSPRMGVSVGGQICGVSHRQQGQGILQKALGSMESAHEIDR